MGGGGGGGVSGYNYTAAIIAGIANGPIAGVGSVWTNKDRTTLAAMNMKVALGTIPQSPWGYLLTKHPEEALNYPGLAYVATPEIFLGRSSAELPNLSFEVYGRTMQKTILDPGGEKVWIAGGPYFTIAQRYYYDGALEDMVYEPIWDITVRGAYDYDGWETGEHIDALFMKLSYPGGAAANCSINGEPPFSITSGVAFDVSGKEIIQLTVWTAGPVSSVYFAREITPEISYFQSSVPGKLDADPAEIIEDFLANPNDGAGFKPEKLGDLTAYSDYCVSAGLLLSPTFTEAKAASEHLKDLLAATNSEAVPSQGLLKIVPYGDMPLAGNGRTYTPDITPLYHLDDSHFLSSGEDPVVGSRVTSADAFNHVQIEFVNRNKDYNVEIAEAKDQADIEDKGLRTMDVVQMHHIADPEVARTAAQILLQRVLYVRNTYKFKLSWNFVLLEPMDIVTITDAGLGLYQTPVRIKTIEEDDDDRLEFTVEEIPPGISTAMNYTAPPATGWTNGNQDPPGDALPPVIFEPPEAICASPDRPEIWIAASGGDKWGGCEVWISTNGETYGSIGFLYGKSKIGTLNAALPLRASPDTINPLTVDLPAGTPALLPGNQADADTLQTLCYVDGELLAYRDASMVAANRYTLRYLVRGAHGTTISAHTSGKPFARLDRQVLRFAYPKTMIGHTVKIKLTSFNLFGKATQSLADVPAYNFALTGNGLAVKPHTEGGASVAVANTGLTVVYTAPFVNLPNLSATIIGATTGQFIDIAAQGLTGFTLYIRDTAGTAIAGTINWSAQGV